MTVIRATKHHGLGNDFVVCCDPLPAGTDAGAVARAWCERRFGIGADGLLLAEPGGPEGADVTMVLHNADGSRAEMSGNGIRCLVQAVRLAGMVAADSGAVRVATDAGLRSVRVLDESGRTLNAAVDMGLMRIDLDTDLTWHGPDDGTGRDPFPIDSVAVDAGNPHVVHRFAELATLDAAADRTAAVPAAVNIEHLTEGPEKGSICMRVVERGVGETMACGTGACAAAWAARRWGMTGDRTVVDMPGGAAEVVLAGDDAELRGPAVLVSTLEMEVPRG